MNVTEAVETRIEIRDYSDEPIDSEVKRAVLEAGRLAPSGKNSQHWRFVLVDTEEDLARLGKSSPSGSWVSGSDFAVVVCTDPTYGPHEIDAGRAVIHMQLVAWEAGVGSCIYTVDRSELDRFLEVPDNFDLTLVAGFGYPERSVVGRKSRRPLSEIAFHGRFGDPLNL